MFSPAISPHNPNYAFVACDMTGSFVTYDGENRGECFLCGARSVTLFSILSIPI